MMPCFVNWFTAPFFDPSKVIDFAGLDREAHAVCFG